jgi:hypothetical protein
MEIERTVDMTSLLEVCHWKCDLKNKSCLRPGGAWSLEAPGLRLFPFFRFRPQISHEQPSVLVAGLGAESHLTG